MRLCDYARVLQMWMCDVFVVCCVMLRGLLFLLFRVFV